MGFDDFISLMNHPIERPVCVSGGAIGSDTLFGVLAEKHGHMVVHAAFRGHTHTSDVGRNIMNVPDDKLQLVDQLVDQAAKILGKRSIWNSSSYVINLIRRNAYQIMYTGSIYAIGELDYTGTMVQGGTGWAVEMYKILCQRKGIAPQIFVLDKHTLQWYSFVYGSFYPMDESEIPTPTGIYTGIGTRKLPRRAAVKMHNFYKERNNETVS